MRVLCLLLGAASLCAQPAKDFQSVFAVDKKNLGTRGDNPYFRLLPAINSRTATARTPTR
ncbi:MAG: hypothetical protein JWP63_6728 [Candidatus Solibacter sp.]|nr:hypothetical protein [Candidatus Solibacter sp.]